MKKHSPHVVHRKTVRTCLLDAADLLESKGWAKYSSARDKNGRAVLCDSPKAEKFCMTGAIWRVAKDFGYSNSTIVRLCEFITENNDLFETEGKSGHAINRGVDIMSQYNDCVAKSRKQVVSKLRELANR